MAAGLGFKTFTTGEVLTAADTNGYLMQGINVFANAAARTAAITSPQEGQYSYLKDTNALEYYDGAAWVGAPVGDITAVTAGKGLTGGGSSGDVTVSLATTAKGDLVAGSGTTTAAVLTVGANNTVLTADSTAATGLKWATVSTTPTFKGVLCTKSASQSISAATWTTLTYDTEVYDTDAFHSTSSNTSRLTVPTGMGGYYLITWGVQAANGDVSNNCKLYINGTTDWGSFGFTKNGASGTGISNCSVIINLSAGDYIEQQVYFGSASTIESNAQNSRPTKFGMQYLGA